MLDNEPIIRKRKWILKEEAKKMFPDKHEDKIIKGFINEIKTLIIYWDSQKDRSSKEKLEGLAHSILCLLDGISGSWTGDVDALACVDTSFMFHEQFHKSNDHE